MDEKVLLKANGLEIEAFFKKETKDEVLIPIIKKLTELYRLKKDKIIVFISAPPGTGKTILSLYIEKLSLENSEYEPIQAVGMDGFHYSEEYLNKNYHENKKLKEIKGAPETFNLAELKEKLNKIKEGNVKWPIYDRNIHDVINDKIEINKNIILIEGNWLLLNEENWKEIKNYCDYSIFIEAKEEELKERLIERKMIGKALNRLEAENFYENSDKKNIERVLKNSFKADLNLEMTRKGELKIK